MTINFKVGNKYITRGGETVECVAVWSKPDIFGYTATCIDSHNEAECYKSTGAYFQSGFECDLDIVAEAPHEIVLWVNVYPDGSIGDAYMTAEEASEHTPDKDAVQIKVTGIYKGKQK